MKVSIITAIYDSYDDLKTVMPQAGVEVDWVCVTDRPREPNGWRLVVEPRPFMHPNLAAKRPKMLPWEYSDAEYSIWIDASFVVLSDAFAREMAVFASGMHGGSPIAQFKHPWRDCIYQEAMASLMLPKYSDLPIGDQMDQYRAWNHPENWGLWATGVIARFHTDEIKKLGERWHQTCQEWGFQDQLSQAPHLRALGLRPTEIPGNHLVNRWIAYEGSQRH